jgi:hypothetical protein
MYFGFKKEELNYLENYIREHKLEHFMTDSINGWVRISKPTENLLDAKFIIKDGRYQYYIDNYRSFEWLLKIIDINDTTKKPNERLRKRKKEYGLYNNAIDLKHIDKVVFKKIQNWIIGNNVTSITEDFEKAVKLGLYPLGEEDRELLIDELGKEGYNYGPYQLYRRMTYNRVKGEINLIQEHSYSNESDIDDTRKSVMLCADYNMLLDKLNDLYSKGLIKKNS